MKALKTIVKRKRFLAGSIILLVMVGVFILTGDAHPPSLNDGMGSNSMISKAKDVSGAPAVGQAPNNMRRPITDAAAPPAEGQAASPASTTVQKRKKKETKPRTPSASDADTTYMIRCKRRSDIETLNAITEPSSVEVVVPSMALGGDDYKQGPITDYDHVEGAMRILQHVVENFDCLGPWTAFAADVKPETLASVTKQAEKLSKCREELKRADVDDACVLIDHSVVPETEAGDAAVDELFGKLFDKKDGAHPSE